MRRENIFLLYLKAGFVLLLVITSLSIYTHHVDWVFMSNVNLIFHEAGHVLFSFFGRYIYVLGGTLGELLIPIIVAIHFALQKNRYVVGFSIWWLSTVLWGISIYVHDARLQQLPLITGDSSSHDWTYLLGEVGILRYDHLVGNIFLFLSMLMFVLSLFYFYDTFKPQFIDTKK